MKKLNDSLNIIQKLMVLVGLAGLSSPSIAAEAATTVKPQSAWSDPVFVMLTILATGLVLVIWLLGKLLGAVLTRKVKAGAVSAIIPVIAMVLMSNSASAQDVVTSVSVPSHQIAIYFLAGLILFELIVILVMAYTVLHIVKPEKTPEAETKKVSFMEKFNASVSIEHEKDIMLDHDYDGIRELDNDLPPWWKYGFYFTIVFAVVYLVIYHITGSAKLQQAEYEEQMQTASLEVEAYKKQAANLVDENTVSLLTDEASLTSGKQVFLANCAACHGQLGEGGVGPNLTDAYWIHGGSIKDIFKTIKYGWPEKGMKAWEKDFGAKQIQEISSFIQSLQGTNPPNAKEKQGDLYQEITAVADSSRQENTDTAVTGLQK